MSGVRPQVVFRFESPGVAVEFEGTEVFVEAQIERLMERVRNELNAALRRHARGPSPAAAPAPAVANENATTAPVATAAATPPTLTEFHKRAHSREGRGALQETILIFAYYLRDVRGQAEFSTRDLARCFDDADVTPPSNLANTLGLMKRSQGFFAAGDGRGRYVLTDHGAAYVQRLIGAQ